MVRQHGRSPPQKRKVEVGGGGGGGVTYVVSFPPVLNMVRCLVPGCPEVVHSVVRMREHFMYRHLFSGIAAEQ